MLHQIVNVFCKTVEFYQNVCLVKKQRSLFFERERAGQTGSTCGNVFIIAFNKAVGGLERQNERKTGGERERKRPKLSGQAVPKNTCI